MPEALHHSLLRAALRQQQEMGTGELLAFQDPADGAWVELATVEDEGSPFPEKERLTAERLGWIAEAVNRCPESPPVKSNIGSPDPTVSAHEARSLPPLGFVVEACFVPPVLWGRVVQRVVDGRGMMEEAIEKHGRCRRSLGFLAGNDPEGVNGWGMDHLAVLGPETSGQRMLGLPDLDPSIFRARNRGDGSELEVSTRALDLDEEEAAPEPAEPAAEGGPAAEEEWTMTPEEMAALAEAIGTAVAAKIEPMMARATPPETAPEERSATTEADATAAAAENAERAKAWEAEVETRLDAAYIAERISATDRAIREKDIKALGREKGEAPLAEIERRTPVKTAREPLNTSGLSARAARVVDHIRVPIEATNVNRTISYVAIRERMGLKPGQEMTPAQAEEFVRIRRQESQAGA